MSGLINGGNLVLGEVVRFHIDDDYFNNYRIDPDKLRAIGRMAGNSYTRTQGSIRHDSPGLEQAQLTRKQPIENFARAVLDLRQLGLQRLAVRDLRRPAMHQLGKYLELRFGIRQAGFGMARIDAQRMIHGAIERRRLQQKLRVGALQVAQWLR